MNILAIETSCDETGVAVIKDGREVLANQVASSEELHKETGGIVPEVAARQQLSCFIPMLEKTLRQFQPQQEPHQTLKEINRLAVTHGPGLIGSLIVGVEAAKTIAYTTDKPLITVNHLHAHILANWLDKSIDQFPQLPGLALIASGGHTQLVLVKDKPDWQFELIGETRDDAAGECFDKCARTLGMGYPGGPAIAEAAEKANNPDQFNLPRPMIDQDNLDFSFSGLKTAVINTVRKAKTNNNWEENDKNNLAWEIQEAITDVLVAKTIRAARKHQIKSLLLGGGVCANRVLRRKLQERGQQFSLFIPPIKYCTDNAAIIGATAYFIDQPTPWKEVTPTPNLQI